MIKISDQRSAYKEELTFKKYANYLINFGRHCNTSAKCTDWTFSLLAKSAIMRTNFRMR